MCRRLLCCAVPLPVAFNALCLLCRAAPVCAAGLHCEGFVLLDAVEKNMRKEFTLEGVYQVGSAAMLGSAGDSCGCAHFVDTGLQCVGPQVTAS